MMYFILFFCGFIYANFVEYVVHRFIFHGLGKKKSSIFSFHWYNHHRSARMYRMVDIDYEKPFWSKNRLPEVLGLTFLAIVHIPMLMVAVPSYLGMIVYLFSYYFIHKYCHLNTINAKLWFPAHFRHHCSQNQDANYGVVTSLFDIIFKTDK